MESNGGRSRHSGAGLTRFHPRGGEGERSGAAFKLQQDGGGGGQGQGLPAHAGGRDRRAGRVIIWVRRISAKSSPPNLRAAMAMLPTRVVHSRPQPRGRAPALQLRPVKRGT